MPLHFDRSRRLERGPAHSVPGYWYVACAAALWGLWSLPLRTVERYQAMPAASESFVLLLVMFLSVAPLTLRRARGAPCGPRPLWSWVLLSCMGFTDALNCLCFFWSMQRTTLAVA